MPPVALAPSGDDAPFAPPVTETTNMPTSTTIANVRVDILDRCVVDLPVMVKKQGLILTSAMTSATSP